ncbi:MAG: hypothetical protein BVN35_17800 [Proteobacteria bacterium ST_bin11]|nr:MAG: hypothetical protein BVN35_17800 [Proteobacteria bacterium ST_bin11]
MRALISYFAKTWKSYWRVDTVIWIAASVGMRGNVTEFVVVDDAIATAVRDSKVEILGVVGTTECVDLHGQRVWTIAVEGKVGGLFVWIDNCWIGANWSAREHPSEGESIVSR